MIASESRKKNAKWDKTVAHKANKKKSQVSFSIHMEKMKEKKVEKKRKTQKTIENEATKKKRSENRTQKKRENYNGTEQNG